MSLKYYGGFNIGGTQSSVSLATFDGIQVNMVSGSPFLSTRTFRDPRALLDKMTAELMTLLQKEGRRQGDLDALGISCGGPLDEEKGVILSPPNLGRWGDFHIVRFLNKSFACPIRLMNDANASVLAEWQMGAGKGCDNIIFLTFGTGLGAGFLLDGRLYSGACGQAGEIGHIRLEPYGPPGYGVIGSAEGFCSGGGIKRMAETVGETLKQSGDDKSFLVLEGGDKHFSAKHIFELCRQSFAPARTIVETSAKKLGYILAVLADIINPEMIIIGGIFPRNEAILYPLVMQSFKEFVLPSNGESCTVKAAALGESIGGAAAISAAHYHLFTEKGKRGER